MKENYKITLNQYKGQSKDYFGFTLQNNFWYGEAKENDKCYKVAASGWESNGSVAVYFKDNNTNEWDLYWVDPSNITVDKYYKPENELSFKDWLDNEIGISYNEFDEYYQGHMAEEIKEQYYDYLYNGIPSFARDTNL